MTEYIERDAVVDLITRRYENPEICTQEINSIPTADVAPVVHGKWDKNGNCTNCGKHAPFWSMSSCYYKSPYCQSCGAKMDGGADRAAD